MEIHIARYSFKPFASACWRRLYLQHLPGVLENSVLMQQKDSTSSQQGKVLQESMKLLKNLSSFIQLQDLNQF